MVLKDFWEKNHTLSPTGEEEEFIPKGFFYLADSIFEHNFMSKDDAVQALHKAGWVEKHMIDLE